MPTEAGEGHEPVNLVGRCDSQDGEHLPHCPLRGRGAGMKHQTRVRTVSERSAGGGRERRHFLARESYGRLAALGEVSLCAC
jgi:hypothetical protein